MGTILIIDDNLHARKLLEHLFKKDYSVIQAENGLEALEILAQFKPRVILMDLMMPVMDGHQLLLAIRNFSDFNDVKIALLSARGPETQDPMLASIEALADKYFVKPVSYLDIKAWVDFQMQE